MGVLLAGIERPRDEAPEALRSRVYRESKDRLAKAGTPNYPAKGLKLRKHGKVEKAKIGWDNIPVQAVPF